MLIVLFGIAGMFVLSMFYEYGLIPAYAVRKVFFYYVAYVFALTVIAQVIS